MCSYCMRLLAVRSHGRRGRYALQAGRAGGSCRQIDDEANTQRGRSGLHSLSHAFVPAPARGAAPLYAAGGTPCMLGAQAAQAHAFVRAPARSALPLPTPEACSPCWARWRLVPQIDGEANAQRGRSGLHSLRHAFVPAPALSAAPRSAAGDTPCMLGAQAAHARAFVRALAPSALPWPPPEARSPCWARGQLLPTSSVSRQMLMVAAVVFTACATRSCRRLLAVRLPCPQPVPCSPCWARRRLKPTRSVKRVLIMAVVVFTGLTTRSCLRLLTARIPWPPPVACSLCWAHRRLTPTDG